MRSHRFICLERFSVVERFSGSAMVGFESAQWFAGVSSAFFEIYQTCWLCFSPSLELLVEGWIFVDDWRSFPPQYALGKFIDARFVGVVHVVFDILLFMPWVRAPICLSSVSRLLSFFSVIANFVRARFDRTSLFPTDHGRHVSIELVYHPVISGSALYWVLPCLDDFAMFYLSPLLTIAF